MPATQTPACTCGNCPAIRMQNGFAPFCVMRLIPSPVGVEDDGFASYSAAIAARKDGQRVVCTRSSFTSGQPRRFALV